MKRHAASVLLSTLIGLSVKAGAQTTSKIVNHGPDGEKLVFVVLGDGYAIDDQAKFKTDVDNLIVKGVFGHDFYKDNFNAFNIYRVDLISSDSGVSSPIYMKDTALKIIYSGKWDRCWLEESADTDQLVTKFISVPKVDFVVILANESGYGGCRRGSRLYLTSGSPWDVVAHEYGHAIAGLYDEYTVDGQGDYLGEPINVKNCSVVPNRQKVVWSSLIDANIDIPSDQAQNINSNDTVGEFTGCDYAETKIYRPVQDCRMRSNTPHFCPVCSALMNAAVQPYLGNRPSGAPLSSEGQPAPPNPNQKFVSMVLRIGSDQTVRVERATEVQGPLVAAPQAAPAYFAAFSRAGQPTAADILVEDPFIVRGFPDPEHKEKGEHLSRGTFATINVTVPNTSLQSATHNFGFQLFRANTENIKPISPSELSDVNHALSVEYNNHLDSVLSVSPKHFGKEVGAAAKAARDVK